MDNRHWSAGASGTPPTPPASPSVGYPSPGDPSLGVPATKGGAFWFHQVGEELRAVLVAAGITPSTATNTQLLEAIQRLIDAQSGNYALDTGAAGAYVVALSPAITAYGDGMTVRVKAVNANPGASTLNAGAGVVGLVNDVGGALAAGDIPAGGIFSATYVASAAKFYITSLVQSQGDARYAAIAGLATNVFNVAAAYLASHAVCAGQLVNQSLTYAGTTGTNTAYIFNPSLAALAYIDGMAYDFQPHLTCGVAPTINVSGLGPRALYRPLNDGSLVPVAPGEISQYVNQQMTYSTGIVGFVLRGVAVKRSKPITAMRDMTLASGAVSYNGVGFKPSKIRALSVVSSTRMKSIGNGNLAAQICVYQGSTSGYDAVNDVLIAQMSSTGGASQSAVIASMDADGFTLSWTRSATPAAEYATIRFFCEE